MGPDERPEAALEALAILDERLSALGRAISDMPQPTPEELAGRGRPAKKKKKVSTWEPPVKKQVGTCKQTLN
jgi:hypothetical protein